MQLTCGCRNITVNVVIGDDEKLEDFILKSETIESKYGQDIMDDEFFESSQSGQVSQYVLAGENAILEKMPVLMRKRTVNNQWDVRRCLLCGADAYALRANGAGGQILVNNKLFTRDTGIVNELGDKTASKISPVFQVIIPKKEAFPSTTTMVDTEAMISAGNSSNGYLNNNGASLLSRGVLQSVQTCMSQYLCREQESMEERIRQFIDQEQLAYERKKADAKLERTKLLEYLANHAIDHGQSGDLGNGQGVYDDDFDVALPVSPLSIVSGDPSPGLTGPVQFNLGDLPYSHSNNQTFRVAGGGIFGMDGMSSALRPKAMSNPASLNGWKRKRHSGGNGATPGLASHAEEHIFNFDEQEPIIDQMNRTEMAGEDEGNITDDSGTGEDYSKYYPRPPASIYKPQPSSITATQKRIDSENDDDHSKFATPTESSLQFRLPIAASTTMNRPIVLSSQFTTAKNRTQTRRYTTTDLEDRDEDFNFGGKREIQKLDDSDVSGDLENPRDLGASIHALALSLKRADDPERLFGERPQRRRWKTGEDQQEARQRLNSMQHANTVSVIRVQKN